MIRMRAAILGAAMVAAASGQACHRGAQPPGRANISMLHYFSGSLAGGADSMVEAFNREHQNLLLSATAIDHESFKTYIGEVLERPNPPELFSYWAGARTRALLPKLSPIDDIWRSAGLDAKFPPALVASASEYGGMKYLLPITQHLVGFFYSKALLSRLGKGEPRDWGEFTALCAAAKAAGIQPMALGAKARWPAQFWYDYLLLRTAGPAFREAQVENRALFSSAPVKRAFGLWKDLLDRGYFNADAAERDWDSGAALDVREGKALMTLMGTWLIGYYTGPDVGWKESEIGFFPFPRVDPAVPLAALGPVDGVILAKEAMNPYAAKEVIRYLADLKPQEAISRGSGALSPNVDVPESFYSPLQLEARKAVSEAEAWAFNYDLAAAPATAEVGLDLFVAFLRRPARLDMLLGAADERNAPNLPVSR